MHQGISPRAHPYSTHQPTRTYPGIAPRSMEITCLRDALLHLTNDGDFQSCAITWARLEVSHYFGDETRGTRTVRSALACGNCAVRIKTLIVSPRCAQGEPQPSLRQTHITKGGLTP